MLHRNDRDIEQKLKALNPAIWAALYPRAYESRGAYASPKAAAVSMMISIVGQAMTPVTDQPTRYANLTCVRLAQFSMPTYFVAEALLHACLQTTLPEGFKYADLRWPMPAMLFILPTGAVQSPVDGSCNFVSIARHAKGARMETLPGLPPFPYDFEYECFSHFAHTSGGATFAGYIPLKGEPMMTDLLAGEKNYSPGIVGVSAGGKPVYETIQGPDDDFMTLTVSICLRLLLLLNAVPEILTAGRELRKADASPKKPTTALWSPNIIGEHYSVQTCDEGVTPGRSPRMHWRRGHYRNQPHGPGLAQRKVIWLEPVLVSVD